MQRILEWLQSNSFLRQVLVLCLAFVVDFFTPLAPILFSCYFAILVDNYYGVKVAVYQKRKIQSKYAWLGIVRKVRDTSIVLVLCNVIERFIIGPDSPFALLTVFGAVIITLAELLSIVENLNTLNPDGPWRIFGAFLKKKGSDKLDVNLEELTKQTESK